VKDAENAPKDGATTAKKKLEAKAVKVEAPVAVAAEVPEVPEVPEVTEVAEVAASEAPVVNEAVIEAVETSAVTDVVAVAEVLAIYILWFAHPIYHQYLFDCVLQPLVDE
jgi:hypothetical protein